jgi:hypothetical protein
MLGIRESPGVGPGVRAGVVQGVGQRTRVGLCIGVGPILDPGSLVYPGY